MKFEDIIITEILPQRAPFLFVDKLLSYGPVQTVTAFRIPDSSVFVEDGIFRSCGIIENMAQSCAARIGYIAKYIDHVPVRIGMLGDIRGLSVHRNPECGETLNTFVTLNEEIFGIALTDVTVKAGDETIAEASIKTVITEKSVPE